MTRPQFHPEDRELLRAVLAAPSDDEPRLVYADRLSERGDPRGELIVVQCALARIEREGGPVAEHGALLRREKELLHAHEQGWHMFGGESSSGTIERGLFTKIAASLDTLRYRWRLFAAHPLEKITIANSGGGELVSGPPLGAWRWLVRKPTAQRATTLKAITSDAHLWFDAKALCEDLAGIDEASTEPTFGGTRVHPRLDRSLRAIWLQQHRDPRSLEELTRDPPALEGLGYTGPHIDALAELLRPEWPRLRSLDLLNPYSSHAYQPFDAALAEVFLAHPIFRTLERLRLPESPFLVAIARRIVAPRLRSLTLERLGDQPSFDAWLPLLTNMSRVSLTSQGWLSAAPLASLPLAHLYLRGFVITEETALSLAASPTLYHFTHWSCRLEGRAGSILEERWGRVPWRYY